MGKIWFLVLVFLSVCFGRENPFVPTGAVNTDMTTTNVVEVLTPFDKQGFKFPSDARNFISITVKYKSEDGSIKEKVVDVNKSINWQDELVLMRAPTPSVVIKPDVSVTMNETSEISPSANSKSDNAEVNATPKRAFEEPLKEVVITPAPTENKDELREPLKKISFHKAEFEIYPMQMKIITKDAKIRDFAVLRDRKIVVDFKNPKGFYTKTFSIDCGGFKTMTFGAHDKFYRVSITLDGKYKYTIKDDKDGYIISLIK